MDDSVPSENTSNSVGTPLALELEQRGPPIAISETCDSPEPVSDGTSTKPTTGPQNSFSWEAEGTMRRSLLSSQKGKQIDASSNVSRKRPLRLLDLPIDILKEIIKEAGILGNAMTVLL